MYFPIDVYDAIIAASSTPATGRKQEVIEQLCRMMGRVWQEIDPDEKEPCDCVCRNKGSDYQNAGHALEFMEEAISNALIERARKRNV